jgi:ribosomal protein L11 methyltransferase
VSRAAWNQVFIELPESLKDAAIGELSELGAAGVWESGEPGPGLAQLTVYFDRQTGLDEIRHSLLQLYERSGTDGEPRLQRAQVDDRDWGEEWKKSWSSFPIGSRFFVIPSWSESQCPEGRFPLYIDPGQAFGTGTHETTQLTLETLERWIEPDRAVLDLGTGSGILAIAAALLGARRVWGCDNDPIAVEVAAENIERNARGRVGLACGSADAMRTQSIDLLLCNLTAETIATIFPDIDRIQRSEAIAIFSGILNYQEPDIRALLLRSGYAVLEEATRGEWSVISTQKHGR